MGEKGERLDSTRTEQQATGTVEVYELNIF